MPRTGCKSAIVLVLVAVLVALSGATVLVGLPHAQSGGSSPSSSSGLTPDGITPGNAVATTCVDVDTCTTPALANVDAGDSLVVIVTEHTTTAGNPSSVVEVTSGGNNAMTLLGSSGCTVLGHGVVAIYGLADVAAQVSVTFTVTYAADEYYTIHALDVEGTAAAPFETAGTPVCSSAAGGTASASVTTTVAGDLVILGVEVRADEAISATGGDSVVTLEEIPGTDSDSGSMLDEADPATGSITLSATFGSAQWAALAIALKPGFIPGTVSPATAAIDASQTIALTSTDASGGSGSYTYQWYDGSATCSAGTAIPGATTLAYTTPALPVGTDYYCVEFTDTVTSETVDSNVAVVTVNPDLSVVVDPASPSIDAGQSITLTAEPSGGTGVDTYLWYAGASCSGTSLASTQSYTTPALSSTTTYCVAVTDSSYSPVTVSATDTVTVSATSLSVTITPNAPSIDVGQSITLTANPSGGTGADSYAWYADATCTGTVVGTAVVYTAVDLASTTTFCVAVTDSAYQPATATATDLVTVSSAPLGVTIVPASPAIDLGQTITLTAEPSGGTGTDSYAWYAGSLCAGTVLGADPTYTTPELTSDSSYCVSVTDSAYLPITANATDTVSVSSAALSVTITPSAPTIDPGQSITLTAEPSGGTGADTYAWYSGGVCSGAVLATTASYDTPALSSNATYCVAVTDSAYEPVTASANDTVTVVSSTLSVSISPPSPSIDRGQSIALTADPSGGVGADTFAWYAGTSCTGTVLGVSRSYTTGALTSNATYCVAATDSSPTPVTATATDNVSVSSAPLSVSISPASPSVDLGQSIQLTAEPSGGTGVDTYAWYPGETCTGTAVATTKTYTTPSLTVESSFCVKTTDSSYLPQTATATDTVAVSSAALTVSISPASPSIDPGQSITLTAHPAGGTGADTYAWYAGIMCSGTVIARGQSYATSALEASSTYCVEATDSAFQPVSATATDTVSVSGAPLTVTITPAEPTVASGHSINLTAVPSGGTGADTYAWYAGAACAGTVLATTPTYATPALAANTTYCVAVTDSSAEPATASANATVTVTAATVTTHGGGSGSGSMSLLGSLWWLLLLLVVAVLLIIILVAGRRRRKKEPPSPLESATAGAMSGAGATTPAEVPTPPEAPTAPSDSATAGPMPESPVSDEPGTIPPASEPSPSSPVESGTSAPEAPPVPEPSPVLTTPSPALGTEATPAAEPAPGPVAPAVGSSPTPPATEEPAPATVSPAVASPPTPSAVEAPVPGSVAPPVDASPTPPVPEEPAPVSVAPAVDSPSAPSVVEAPAPGPAEPAPGSSSKPKTIGDWLFGESTSEGEGPP